MSQEQSAPQQQHSLPLTHFSITKTICSGRHSVYHAYDHDAKRQVVLKTFPFITKLNQHYLREKSHLIGLQHPHIIQLYEAVDVASSNINPVEEEVSYLALEYAPFGDLLEIISTYGAMPQNLAKMLFLQLLEATSYLHRRNIAHMDLKMENILIDGNFNLKLIDFDLSQSLDSPSLESKGTPSYRAPEFKKGICGNLQAVDVYSAAVILFIMVTGHPPYSEVRKGQDSDYDMYYRLLRASVTRFWEVHSKHKNDPEFYAESFKNLVTAMLAEDPMDRPTLEDVINSEWCQGSRMNPEEFKEEMKKYLQKD